MNSLKYPFQTPQKECRINNNNNEKSQTNQMKNLPFPRWLEPSELYVKPHEQSDNFHPKEKVKQAY